jgi:NAD-dependent dihydropyrimidine dehydrogenase PreA subunit
MSDTKGPHDKQPPGVLKPVVDFGKCEAKGPCVEVCPYEIRKIEQADYDKLGFFGKFKNRVHGSKVAYTPKEDLCRACGLCIKACPEHAIKLIKVRKG